MDPVRYFPFNVAWQISDGTRSVPVAAAQTALEAALRRRWPAEWQTQVGELWAKLALNECLEYCASPWTTTGSERGWATRPAWSSAPGTA